MNFKKVIGQGQSEAPHSAAPAETTSTEKATPAPSAYSNAGTSRPSPSVTRNVLSSDVEIKGAVNFSDDLVVDGKIEGEINSTGNLTIGENARIKAEVKTGTIVVYGKVHGNLTATDRIDLKASAEVVGDIKAKTLSIEAGAIFVGKSTVGSPAQAPAAASTQTAAAPVVAKTPTTETTTPVQGTLAGTHPQS
jgi:cytoskeletal protein CcmA (bactofilin family)